MQIVPPAITGVILDLDGVLWIGGSLNPDATTLLFSLESKKISFCILTNDCSVSKANRLKVLVQAGLVIKSKQFVTAVEVARDWLKDNSINSIMYLGAPAAQIDLVKDFNIREVAPVDAVVIGDLFACYNRDIIDRAAKAISQGAHLVAMQRNQRWSDGIDWHVDNGFWVAGFEYVTGKKAIVTGKPYPTAYQSALSRLGTSGSSPQKTFFVSDDAESDLKGAKTIGMKTVYYGNQTSIPPWVDYTIKDLDALASLLIGDLGE